MSSPPDSFTGDWITPDHLDYSKAIARWAANAERRAKVVAFVKNAQDVAIVLRYAKQHNLPIAIRGGGHSPAGASSIENGLVIDLSRYLSSVRVDPAAKLAYVGGGAIWETVDKTAIEHDLATVAGTVNHVSNPEITTLLLGGGYGFLTGEHGLAQDNLAQATVVTARGEILTASATENADLFWAIRGAGCNFGVVTEFVLRLHPQRRTVFAGIVAYQVPETLKAVSVLANSWTAGLFDKEALSYAQTTDPAGNPLALFLLFWNGSEEEGRARFKPFFDISHVMDTCKEIPFEELNGLQNFNVPHGKNYYMKGVFSSGLQADVADKLVSRLPQLSAESGVNFFVVHECVPTNKILAVPNHATAHIRGPRINILILATWDSKDTNILDTVRDAANELGRILVQAEKIIPESLNVGYGNYIPEYIESAVVGRSGSKVDAKALFGENYARLQKLKQEYDPDLVFFKWCPITPQA
ncbi:FAD-binding domain-containing protein [Lactarius psammicola]|nr:FAD-binding domain-containing protein [Lactarius psammicola]